MKVLTTSAGFNIGVDMLVDIFELPIRYNEFDSCLDTTMVGFDYWNGLEETECYGRSIPLDIFRNNNLKKYKSIEQFGADTLERIFFSEEEIDFNKPWWTSGAKVYPIQTKVFSYANPIKGQTTKYVRGITELMETYAYDKTLVPTALKRAMFHDPEITMRSPYNFIIPSLDSDVAAVGFDFKRFPGGHMDNWVLPERKLCDLSRHIGHDYPCRPGFMSYSLIERPVDDDDYMICTDPLHKSWRMYDFISYINDLAVSDIRITLDRYAPISEAFSVTMSSRYSGLFDYTQFPDYQEVRSSIIRYANDMMHERYSDDPWTKIVIEKLWSEEIYITSYMDCEGRSSLIDTYTYIDLPVFLLGTVGLY